MAGTETHIGRNNGAGTEPAGGGDDLAAAMACFVVALTTSLTRLGDSPRIRMMELIAEAIRDTMDVHQQAVVPRRRRWKVLTSLCTFPRFVMAVSQSHLQASFLALSTEVAIRQEVDQLNGLEHAEFVERIKTPRPIMINPPVRRQAITINPPVRLQAIPRPNPPLVPVTESTAGRGWASSSSVLTATPWTKEAGFPLAARSTKR
jgi:hypothetical protein